MFGIEIPCNTYSIAVLHGVHLLRYQPVIESNASEIDTSFKPCQLSMCSFNFTFLFQQFSFSFHFFKISVSPALFHSTKPIWDTHGQTSMVATSSHRVPHRHHLRKFMLVWPSPLLKCLSLFSCSLKLSHGRDSPCSHHLRIIATTSIELTVSLGGFVNMISEPLLPNSPLSVIIFRKKSHFIFYFFQYFDVNCFVCLVFCVYFAFILLFLGCYHHSPVNRFPLFKVTMNYLLE